MEQRSISKVYANIETSKGLVKVVLKDNLGSMLEDYEAPTKEARKNVRDYEAVVKALELSAKHCRNKVYVFTDNRLLTNQFYGSMRIKNKELLRRLMEVKLLEGFFKCVRLFHVRRKGERPASKMSGRRRHENKFQAERRPTGDKLPPDEERQEDVGER